MSIADPFGRTDTLDDSMLQALVVRFEARGKNPRFSQMLQEYLDAMHIDHADPLKGKAYDETLVNTLVTNPRVMRQMPRLLREAGLELVTSLPYVLSEVGEADFWSSAIEAYRRLMARAKAMTGEEAAAWASALRRDSDEGVFFGSSNYYAYVARRP
jgi:hypothetical protein